ncbi:MAG TPA: cupredoxin domain-containing protein [Dehalococcoidia bacterium]|nr:cupredoxin domain-containing protein [Dehalococcoidia bacterium]
MFKKLLVVFAVLSAAVFLIACGGGDDDDDSSSGSGTGGGAVEVKMVDIAFEPKTLTGRVGQAITLNLTNAGAQPHTFTIAGLVDSQRVEPGQSKSINFTPTQAGTLTFICTVHGQAAMSGTMTVN